MRMHSMLPSPRSLWVEYTNIWSGVRNVQSAHEHQGFMNIHSDYGELRSSTAECVSSRALAGRQESVFRF